MSQSVNNLLSLQLWAKWLTLDPVSGMEDDHCHFLPMEDDPEASFFAVFDGHGGEGVGNGR